jgi:hypothetical protein
VGEKSSVCKFWHENLNKRDYFEDPYINDRIILKWIIENYDGAMDWFHLA